MNLTNAQRTCASIIQKNSQSFYAAFKDLPEPKLSAVCAVYAFCRVADDAVDLTHDRATLDRLEAWIDHWNDEIDPDDAIQVALSDAVQRFQLDPVPFKEQLHGQRLDLNFKQPQTDEELFQYCYYVASTVGLMLLPILATQHHPELRHEAIDLGIAMQLTNILRDVGEDARNGRCYLPQSRMTPAIQNAIEMSEVTPEFITLWESLATIAEAYYERGLVSLHRYDKDSILALAKSAVYYKGILNAVRQANYNCLTQRAYVRDFDTLRSELQALLRKDS